MKALDYLYRMKKANDEMGMGAQNIDEAIAELEALQKLTNTAIEEIEYALDKPEYADVYLNNAIRFLKDKR